MSEFQDSIKKKMNEQTRKLLFESAQQLENALGRPRVSNLFQNDMPLNDQILADAAVEATGLAAHIEDLLFLLEQAKTLK